MAVKVTVLGANSAIPTTSRFPTSQLLNVNETYYLIDCGEGTQIQLRRYKLKFQRIKAIFISHLHGDHYFGLIGLLNTMHLLKREKPLTIVCPEGLHPIIELQLKSANTVLNYPVHFSYLNYTSGETVYEDSIIKVQGIKLKHKISCTGFVFREQAKARNIKKQVVEQHQLNVEQIKQLKAGKEVMLKDQTLGMEVLEPEVAPKSYAFVTDTRKLESIIPFIQGVDLLYHEATFLDQEKALANKTYHSTAKQAAELAKEAKIKQLLIGHYSTRYHDLQPLLEEAKAVFKNTQLAVEGEVFEV